MSVIDPVLAGAPLMDEIRTAAPAPGAVGVWRTGQAGVVCRFAAGTVWIDQYLSNHCEAILPAPFDHRRMTRAPLDPAEVDVGDVVICTHDHPDHLDPPTVRTLARQLPGARIVVPAAAVGIVRDLGWDDARVVGTRAGDEVRVGGLTITALAVAHEDFDEDPVTGHPYQGYVVSDGAVSVAHLGDTVAHERIAAALRRLDVDVLFVPVNGRSPERAALGFAGNTSAEEAVDLAVAAGVAHVVPVHYDMFAQNVDADALSRFRATARRRAVATTVLDVGARRTFPGR